MNPHLILIVEDDSATRSFLANQLVADGYEILLAETRQHALHLLAAHHPQLVLADINGHTLGLLDAVRNGDGLAGAIDPNTPMVVLTSRADELDRVRVFDRGGDDVLAKPFSYPELRGRIRALLRRAREPHTALVTRVGALTVNHSTREVRVGDRHVELAPKEFELLQALIADPTRVFTREELLRAVWGYRTPSRTVDSHACRLRQKLSSSDQRVIINVWGVGYRLCDPAAFRATPLPDAVPARSRAARR
jgi:DNA-binding response OmpR family regulator